MSPLAPNTKLIRLMIQLFLARFSPNDIERATRHPLRIALCGDRGAIEDFRDLLVEGTVPRGDPFPSLALHALPADDPANAWQVLDDAQFAVVMLPREHLLGDTLYRVRDAIPLKVPTLWIGLGRVEPWLRYEVQEISRELNLPAFRFIDELTPESIAPVLTDMLKLGGGYDVAMARKLPLLRDIVAARIVARTSRQNLTIAVASALPASIPWLGPVIALIGVTGEIIFLTANQLRMVLQIASLYGLEMNLTERFTELLPVIGGAFGWRAASRELVGFIPAIGPAVKGSVAFAGTFAIGESARWFYRTGRHLDATQRQRIFHDAYARAGVVARQAADWFLTASQRRRREFVASLMKEQPALPPWNEDADAFSEPFATDEAQAEKRRGFRLDSREDEPPWPPDENPLPDATAPGGPPSDPLAPPPSPEDKREEQT